ncbi:MAG: ABC transporter ATP-binding protein [Alphaproteobacteria bacterium]|nr:ABC transporter ATP-binding protein [Alphaproteobacteria bacterium]
MLALEAVDARYGRSQALFGIDLRLGEGEVVSLLGRNGMGKTTTIRTICGLLPVASGRLLWRGAAIAHLPPHRRAWLGIGLVPEGRQVFPNLTVAENLLVAEAPPRDKAAEAWTLARVYAMFPRLTERKASMGAQLSGGEQQMLAIGRALMTNPRLLILDEATEGLAPLLREEIWRCLIALKAAGQSILIVDKHLSELMALCHRHIILERGRVVWSGDSGDLAREPGLQARYLGV